MASSPATPLWVTSLPGSAAAAAAWRSHGQLHISVIVKATFAFAPSSEMTLTEPQPILQAEVHHGNMPGRSVRFTSDLVPFLGRADVLFTGHAHAPGAAVQSLPVRLAVFDGRRFVLDKKLLVKDKAGFQQMPMMYERALSGASSLDNPLGIDQATDISEPNIIDPAEPSRPAGFGPIARAWPIRKRLLGNTPRAALDGPIAELPEDFDWSYFQAAPLDQRIHFIHGDEWVVLEGLHPSMPSLQMRLPGARGFARIYGLSAFGVPEGELLELAADTLRIDGDEERCTLVFRKTLPVASEEALAAVRVVGGVALPGEELAWADPAASAPAPEPPPQPLPTPTPPPLPSPRPKKDSFTALVTTPILDIDEAAEEDATPSERVGTTMSLSDDELRELQEQLTQDIDDIAPPQTKKGVPAWLTQERETANVSPAESQRRTSGLPFRSAPAGIPSSVPRSAPRREPSHIDLSSVTLDLPPERSAEAAKRPASPWSTGGTLDLGPSGEAPPLILNEGHAVMGGAVVRTSSELTPELVDLRQGLLDVSNAAVAQQASASKRATQGAGGTPWAARPDVHGSSVSPVAAPLPVLRPTTPAALHGVAAVSNAAVASGSVEPPLPAEASPAWGGASTPLPPQPDVATVQVPAIVMPAEAVPSASPAALQGAYAASNAAVASQQTPPAEPSKSSPPAAFPRVDERFGFEAHEVIDLLWFDPKSLPRVRKQPAFRHILDALRDEPPDPDIDDPALEEEPAAAEERREIFEVLAHGGALTEGELRTSVQGAVRDDGRFVAPLVLLAGELALPFDEIEALKALVATVTPLVGNDDRLKATVAAAKEFLQALDPLSSPAAAEGLVMSIKDAYGKSKRALALPAAEARVERALLENRRYQKRAIFGGKRLRALFTPPGTAHSAAHPIPAYLPESLAESLPMFARLRARILAEAHLPADQHESHPVALRVVALARVGAPIARW